MNNEKGFVLPITLIIMFLLCSFVLFQVSLYDAEKKLLKEERDLYTAERVLQMGVIDVSKLIIIDHRDHFSGKIYYEEGEVTYNVKKEREGIKSIHLISKTVQQKSKRITFYYYVNDESVLPWLEER